MEIDRRAFVLTTAAAAGCSLLTAPGVASRTASPGLNHRSTDGEALQRPVEVDWSVSQEAVGDVSVARGLYLSASPDGELVARDVGDGSEVWRHEGPGSSSRGVAAYDELVAYTSGNTTYGVEVSTGKELWRMQTRTPFASTPTVTSDSVFVGRSNSVYELGSISGGERWSYETGGPVHSKPAFDGGYTYVGSDDGKLYRFDDEGLRDWQHELGGDVRAAPVLDGGIVHAVDIRGNYHGVDVSTGEEEWSRRLLTRVDRDMALGAGRLCMPTDEGVLLGFDSSNGVQEWRFDADGSPAYSPWIAGDVVYFAAGSTLYALDTGDGSERWSVDVSGARSTHVAGSAVYVGGSSSTKLSGSGSDGEGSSGAAVVDAGLESTEVDAGGSVDVVATVENSGGSSETMEVVVYVDGEERDSAEVEVAGGGSEERTFTLSFPEAGSFDVRVNEVEAGTVEVEEPDGSGGSTGSDGSDDPGTPSGIEVPLPGFGAGAATVSLAAAYLYRFFDGSSVGEGG